VLAWLALAPTPGAAELASLDRPAAEIAADVAAAWRESNGTARSAGKASEAYKAAVGRYCELVAELQKVAPDHADLPKWATQRWAFLAHVLDRPRDVEAELTKHLEAHPTGPLDWPARSSLVRVRMLLARGFPSAELAASSAAFDDVVARYGDSADLADLFYDYADFRRDSPRIHADLLKQFVAKFPAHKRADAARARLAQLGRVGEVFELEFTDALSGKPVSTKNLRGKVLVVDFWATWCGPCMREMPRMKELYAKYKDHGVEFLGVSLDKSEAEGGRKALLRVCAAQGLGWPQYYGGAGEPSVFASEWGVRTIPALFLVDHEGKLVTTDARGRLDELIPNALEKARAATK
jgi:thiol-disulfide isomerase/thioredoxin